jgi:hypothetical protein
MGDRNGIGLQNVETYQRAPPSSCEQIHIFVMVSTELRRHSEEYAIGKKRIANESQGSTMYLSNSNTQVYSPFGTYVVEQHDVENGQEANGAPVRIHQHFPLHALGPTSSRMKILWNIMLHKYSV